MDQKRLFLAIGISVAILVMFQFLSPSPPPRPPAPTASVQTGAPPAGSPTGAPTASVPAVTATAAPVPREVPRVTIAAPRVAGSISLLGARIDDVVLRDYRETIERNSPLV